MPSRTRLRRKRRYSRSRSRSRSIKWPQGYCLPWSRSRSTSESYSHSSYHKNKTRNKSRHRKRHRSRSRSRISRSRKRKYSPSRSRPATSRSRSRSRSRLLSSSYDKGEVRNSNRNSKSPLTHTKTTSNTNSSSNINIEPDTNHTMELDPAKLYDSNDTYARCELQQFIDYPMSTTYLYTNPLVLLDEYDILLDEYAGTSKHVDKNKMDTFITLDNSEMKTMKNIEAQNEHNIELETNCKQIEDKNRKCVSEWNYYAIIYWLNRVNNGRFNSLKYINLRKHIVIGRVNGSQLCYLNQVTLNMIGIYDKEDIQLILYLIADLIANDNYNNLAANVLLTDIIPISYCDPISFELMDNPVLLKSSGTIYERYFIEQYVKMYKKDPLSGKVAYIHEIKKINTLSININLWTDNNYSSLHT